MGVTEEIYKIKYMVEGQSAIDRLKGDIKGLEQNAAALAAAFKQGQVNQATFAATAQAIAARIADARKELAQFQAVANGGSNSRRTMMFYQFGQAIEDMQYGLHGAINNLNYLAQASNSVGPKVQAALMAAAIAAGLLARNMHEIYQTFDLGWKVGESGVEAFNKRLDEANNKLAQMKRIVADGVLTNNPLFRVMMNPMGIFTQQQFIEAQAAQVDAENRAKMMGGFEAFMGAGGNGQDEALAKGFGVFAATTNREAFASAIQQALEDQGAEAPAAQARDLISKAMGGSRAAFEKLMELAPEFADQMASVDPGRQAAREVEVQKAIDEKRKSRELNQQGQEQEVAGRRQTVDDAISRVGDVSGRIRLAIRDGMSDEEIAKNLSRTLREEGADPAFAKRRAEEMVKAERQAAGRDFGAASARVPLMEERVRRGLLEGQVAGFDSQDVRDRVASQLANELEKAGLNPEEARFRAFKTVEDQGLRIQEEIARETMFPKMGKVDTVAATDWTRSVQDSMDYAKTQTEYQKKMVDHLADIARRGGGVMN